jgi:peptide/histidine transporter 3/4
MAMSATSSNLIVYLIREYNVKSIDAAQISNVVRGCMQLAPVLGALLSDAYFGCYPVVAAGVAISLLVRSSSPVIIISPRRPATSHLPI